MKRNWTGWAALLLILSGQSVSAQAPARQTTPSTSQQVVPDIIFDAGNGSGAHQDVNVDADNYLRKMRVLIEDYNRTVGAAVLGPSGANMDQDGMNTATQHTQMLAGKISAVKAPREVAAQHAQLAASLSDVENFLQLGGSGTQGLPAALTLSTKVHTAVGTYHQAVMSMINQRGLSASLDPFATESAADKQRALQGIDQLQQQSTGLGEMGGLGGATGMGTGLGTGLGTAGGVAPDMSSLLQGIMGGSTGAGGLPGSSDATSGPNALGDLLKQMGSPDGGLGTGPDNSLEPDGTAR